MGLEGTLDVAVTDDAVEFEFTVTNAGAEDVALTFPNALEADFVVRSDGEQRWRWSDGKMFAQMIQNESIPAGESKTYEAAWSDPTDGHYEVTAELTATDVDVEATGTFSV